MKSGHLSSHPPFLTWLTCPVRQNEAPMVLPPPLTFRAMSGTYEVTKGSRLSLWKQTTVSTRHWQWCRERAHYSRGYRWPHRTEVGVGWVLSELIAKNFRCSCTSCLWHTSFFGIWILTPWKALIQAPDSIYLVIRMCKKIKSWVSNIWVLF